MGLCCAWDGGYVRSVLEVGRLRGLLACLFSEMRARVRRWWMTIGESSEGSYATFDAVLGMEYMCGRRERLGWG